MPAQSAFAHLAPDRSLRTAAPARALRARRWPLAPDNWQLAACCSTPQFNAFAVPTSSMSALLRDSSGPRMMCGISTNMIRSCSGAQCCSCENRYFKIGICGQARNSASAPSSCWSSIMPPSTLTSPSCRRISCSILRCPMIGWLMPPMIRVGRHCRNIHRQLHAKFRVRRGPAA